MPELYNIPSGFAFAPTLAHGLKEMAAQSEFPLTSFRILLPTRRACRTLRDSFLRLEEGKPVMLPRLQPLGDVEEDELGLELAGQETAQQILDLPPALSPLRRRILLARAILKLPDHTTGPDQAFALAGALGRLMDQIYTEDLSLKNLPALVKDEQLAQHWQITVRFLEILSETWPDILSEHGVIDAADRRNRLMNTLAEHWQNHPPQTPIIAAGSTGSIPATGKLLQIIAGLPHGSVILPGLDTDMDSQSWDALDDTHPQATLKQLLARMNVDRTAVKEWPYRVPPRQYEDEPQTLSDRKLKARRWLASEMMRPAATAQEWQNLNLDEDRTSVLKDSLKQVMRFECDTSREEARLIGLLMRKTLEDEQSTAALITPDRSLARRVAMMCRKWGIEADDSGGLPLHESVIGSFLRLSAQAVNDGLRPSSLTALLKHKFCRLGMDRETLTAQIDEFEIDILRGPAPEKSFKGLYDRAEENKADATLVKSLEPLLTPFMELASGYHPFGNFLDEHIRLVEALAKTPDQDGADILWQRDDGEAAAHFLADLRDHARSMPDVNAEDYLAILDQLMRTVNVRSPYGTHPRVFIFGQLEARLIEADLIILGGLNEGTWPPDPGTDPWMSRPMRKDFKLPSPERGIGLSAHDFVQGFCNKHVVLTRARRVDGTPTVPSRWLQRLDTVLQALKIDQNELSQGHGQWMEWAKSLDEPHGEITPVTRPQPKPPVSARPTELYVTAIEKWMRDPYHIYARYILKLKKLKPLEEQADAAERGTIIHDILDKFVLENPKTLPGDAYERMITLGLEELGEKLEEPRLWGFWWPRFERLADWFVIHERQWRQNATFEKSEVTGRATLDIDGTAFTLAAKADRIDLLHDGSAAIIDYKTGSTPPKTDIEQGYAPQIPLEAVILLENGFAGIDAEQIGYMGFWQLTGADEAGKDVPVNADTETARQGVIKLIRTFANEDTPYYSLPRPDKAPPAAYQDYAHLARVQEWAALDDNAEDAA